jgi:PTH1 family peptidyl-tRNA hydrolase
MAGTALQIIVGLGNPGPEHRLTRHNAGFWFVDALARGQSAQFRSHSRYQGEIARVSLEGRELVLLKPQTYMNRSGISVRSLVDYMKAPLSEVLVVHDELDLPPGEARLKFGGGTAGHNGLRDIATQLGTPDFWRLRIGVGHPRESAIPQQDVADYVLAPPPAGERTAILAALDRALDAWPAIMAGEYERAMLLLHTRKETP